MVSRGKAHSILELTRPGNFLVDKTLAMNCQIRQSFVLYGTSCALPSLPPRGTHLSNLWMPSNCFPTTDPSAPHFEVSLGNVPIQWLQIHKIEGSVLLGYQKEPADKLPRARLHLPYGTFGQQLLYLLFHCWLVLVDQWTGCTPLVWCESQLQ